MSRAALILVCLIFVFFPLVNAESIVTDQEINENTELRFAIKDYTNIFSQGKETPKMDSLPSDEEILQIPPAVKSYERVTFDQQGINSDLRSTSPQISFQIDGAEFTADLKRMDFESIDDEIDSYSGTISGLANSSVLLTIGDNATIGSITLNDETYYIEPVQTKTETRITERIPHIIYSSNDVENREFLIDNGPINSNENEPDARYRLETMNAEMENMQPMDAVPDGRTAVTVLVVTDNQFYSDHSGYGWKIVAQDIIAEANRQFGRDDIGVILIPVYNDSKRQNLTNHLSIRSYPFAAFVEVYPKTSLIENSADLGLYLGGYDKTTGDDQGSSDGYGNVTHPHYGRHSWAQMVPDDPFYLATTKGRRVISIHELGHQFGAHHEDAATDPLLDTPGFNRAFQWGGTPPLNLRTVMWSEYSETANTYEFSSLSYMGDLTHDNARRIRETKGNVSRYAGCSASHPSADFIWAPASPPANQMMTFTITNRVNDPTYYFWDFGNGATSSAETPEYAYPEGGIYTVRLTAANCAGSTITEHDITITNPSIRVNFFGMPLIGGAPLTVLFTDSSTPTPTSWNWSFGDGKFSEASNPQHTYYQNGSYSVTLTVIKDGVPSTKILPNYITVAPQAPNTSFTSFIKSGTAPLFIQFIDTSKNNPTSWNWSFDDGTTFNTTNSLQKNVSHTFTTVRSYNVTLTAVNTLGSNTAFQLITVTNTPPPTDTSPFEKTGAGSYTYTSPAGIYSVNITLVGAGGGGGGGTYDSISGTSNGGNGGNASLFVNSTQIISPGSVITVKVGAKGTGGKGQCGQINGNSGSNGEFSGAGNIIVSGGPGGRGGIYSPTITQPNGLSGQDGFGFGHYATSGYTGAGTGGVGGTGRGAGGGGAGGGCGASAFGGNGADGYVKIQPIVSPPPLADFTANHTLGQAPFAVAFTDNSTGNPTKWNWSFGDNSTSSERNPVHVYNTDGSFTVSLNATNPGGSNISTKTGYICTNCIRPIPPVADFTVNVTSGTLPLTVAFFGKTVGGPTNTWLWNFGDGQNSTLQNSVHKYNAKGNYSISLTIKNTAGTSTRVLPNWIRAGFDIITVNNTQNNSTISIAQNNIIRLGLNQCTSCGYEWSLNITPGLNVINTSFIKNPSLPGINGGSGQNVWDITAVSIGEQNITAVYKRPGIPLTGNELAFRLNITVNRQSTKIGTVRNNNTWLLDVSGNGAYGAGDLTYAFGKANDTYVTGDWNNDRKTEIGVFRDNTTWLLDTSGNGAWGTGDTTFAFGTKWDVPVTGDWNGDGKTEIGVVRNKTTWLLDTSGNGAWGTGDTTYTFGTKWDVPVTGDWNGDGKTEIGVVRNKTTWLLDTSGNGAWGTGDTTYTFGTKWDVPVTGDWNRNGKTEIGVFRNSTMWLLDYNGNGIWNGISIDRQYNYGLIKDIPVTGNW